MTHMIKNWLQCCFCKSSVTNWGKLLRLQLGQTELLLAMDSAPECSCSESHVRALVVRAKEAIRFCDRGSSGMLTYKYLRGIHEGEQVLMCSHWKTWNGKNLLRIHGEMNFVGNRFIPDNSLMSMAHWHGLSASEYELLRAMWPRSFRKRDGAVAWQFEDVETSEAWAACPNAWEDSVAFSWCSYQIHVLVILEIKYSTKYHVAIKP